MGTQFSGNTHAMRIEVSVAVGWTNRSVSTFLYLADKSQRVHLSVSGGHAALCPPYIPLSDSYTILNISILNSQFYGGIMFEKILFATTGTPACDHAAHVAFDLTKKYQSKLYLFHVFGRPTRSFSPYVVDARTGEEDYYDKDYVEWVKEELKNTYIKQIKEVPVCEVETLAGIPHTEILRYARKQDIDLIVMGAHSRQEEPGQPVTERLWEAQCRKLPKGLNVRF